MSFITPTPSENLTTQAINAIGDLQSRCSTSHYDDLLCRLQAFTPHLTTRPVSNRHTLTEQAIHWLAHGDRGASSETLFTHITGIDALRGSAPTHPTDAIAYGRCRKLLEECPELNAGLHLMRAVSPSWKTLVENWDLLNNCLDAEAPNWRNHRGTAPNTFARIRLLLEHDDGCQGIAP